jgi:hypothetical protein
MKTLKEVAIDETLQELQDSNQNFIDNHLDWGQ